MGNLFSQIRPYVLDEPNGRMLHACKDRTKRCGQQSKYRLRVSPELNPHPNPWGKGSDHGKGNPYQDAPRPSTTPNAFNDITLWFDAAFPGFSYADNTRMTTGWNDLSGNNRHFTQDYGAGTYGLYKTNSGKPYVDFDTSSIKIGRQLVQFTDFMGLTAGTIYFVINQYHATQPNAVSTHRPGDSSNKWLQHLAFSDNNFYIDWGNQFGGGRFSTAMPVGWRDGTFKILEIRRNGNACRIRWGKTASISTLVDNGSAYTTGRTNTTDNLDLGGVSGFGWQLSHFLTWKRSLSDAECDAVYAYLLPLKP